MDYTFTDTKIETFEEFTEEIIDSLKSHYGARVKIKTHSVTKNNGVTYTGLVINKNRKELISPTIYLEPYFDDYNSGRRFDEIIEYIIKQREENTVTNDFDPSIVMDFDKVKNNICVKLVNAERNKELLTNVPHKKIKDLVAIFYILAFTKEDGNGTITITKEMMNKWHCSIKINELYKLALENTQRLFPAQVNNMNFILNDIMGLGLPPIEEVEVEYSSANFKIYKDVGENTMPIYVATNVNKVCGANVILYDGLLKAFAEKVKNSFYILPSSVHEVIFMSVAEPMSAKEIKEMVCNVNSEAVDPQEFLSDNIYLYDMDTDSIRIV